MANNYLNSILSVLSAVQARQLSELIQGLQVSGTVRNKDEYSKTLAELSQRINDKDPRPSFSPLYSKVWSLCSSDAHNLMMTAAKNDLEAIFIQTNEIGDKLEDHHLLFLKNTLADLNRSLLTQEATIKRLEWLSDKNNEFTEALINTFSSPGLETSRSDSKSNILFFDNREEIQVLLPSSKVSEGDSLVLGDRDGSPRVYPISVKLQTDEYSYMTERDVDNSDISNLIDGKENTFWSYNVYLVDAVPEVHIVLEFSFGNGKDLNYMVIDPATTTPFSVTNIDGIGCNGDRINLLYQDTEVDGRTRINFARQNVRKILVTLSTKTSHREEYYTRVSPVVVDNPDQVDRANALSISIREVINSDTTATVCNIPETPYEQINKFSYSFILDNVWFGNSTYKDTGVFMSAPLSLTNAGVVGVFAKEKEESGIIQNSIEYDLVKVDTFPKEKVTRIAIPRLNQTDVTSEVIIPVKRSSSSSLLNDVSKLRFLPDLEETVSLYKNGILQTIGEDWVFAVAEIAQNSSSPSFSWRGDVSSISYTSFNVAPLGFYIWIPNFDPRALYTIDYSIFHGETLSNSGYKTIWLDKEKTASLGAGGRITFQKDLSSYTKSDIYLQITLRRNKASRSETSELYEYALLATTYNE
jgi:hypothetical protein